MKALKNELCTLCSEYADIFSDKLASQPAALKPIEINLPKQMWEVPGPQTSKKEEYLDNSIVEMLEDGVIERSNAAYYSHSVSVLSQPICIVPASSIVHSMKALSRPSFPIPVTEHLFERIGNEKPDVLSVMDLTAGYH